MLKALYNKIKSYLLCVKTNINNNKYNCKVVKIPLRVPLKHVLSLSSPMVFNGILKYH